MGRLKFVNKTPEIKPSMTVKQAKYHRRGSNYRNLFILSILINILTIVYYNI